MNDKHIPDELLDQQPPVELDIPRPRNQIP